MLFFENRELVALAPARLATAVDFELRDIEPSRAKVERARVARRVALMAVSVMLSLAVILVLAVTGSAVAEAAPMVAGPIPEFSATQALLAKQDDGIGGLAIAAVAFVALGMLTMLPRKTL